MSTKKHTEENLLEDTAKLFLAVFSEKYTDKFEKMLVAGGGGNSMFVNAWDKPATTFRRKRISDEAIKRLEQFGHDKNSIPHDFIYNNAKTASKRREKGKELHEDHNPSNVKVLHLIRDHIRCYPSSMSYDKKLNDLKDFLRDVQTVDIITIEQDDSRTYKDNKLSKKQKDMLSAEDRDLLIEDELTYLD